MTQASGGQTGGRIRVPARSNVYTVLVVIAAVALAVGCGYVAMKNMEMTRDARTGQSYGPFHIVPAP